MNLDTALQIVRAHAPVLVQSASRSLAHLRFAGFTLSVFGTRLFGVDEASSIMNFSSLGALHCICGTRHAEQQDGDRRQVCRDCGNEIVSCSSEDFDRELSAFEIASITASLRSAGIRARNVEIPKEIRSLDELNAYLDSPQVRRGRKPPRRPNAPVSQAARSTVH